MSAPNFPGWTDISGETRDLNHVSGPWIPKVEKKKGGFWVVSFDLWDCRRVSAALFELNSC